MSKHETPIGRGMFYHIYNRRVNSRNLFNDSKTYEHFLNLFEKYISFVVYLYAWFLKIPYNNIGDLFDLE